jgi:ATP/maltotriose-dependent transcriptional regulator MalT/DNA-binding SARP family transcriptional activator
VVVTRITDVCSRAHLVDRSSSRPIVVVEAQAGAGKSTLLDELTRAHDGPAARATLTGRAAGRGQLRRRLHASLRLNGLSDLSTALEQGSGADPARQLVQWLSDHDEPLQVAIDDVHLANDDLAGLLADLVEGWPPGHRLILSGRRLPSALRSSLTTAPHVTIGPTELRLGPDETRLLLADPVSARLDDGEVALLTDRCDGWAAAIALADIRLQRALDGSDGSFTRHLGQLLAQPATFPDLLSALLEDAPADVRTAVQRVASLPMFDDDLVAAAGLDRGIAAIADLGLPLEPAHDGLWGFPNAVRDALAADRPDEHLVQRAADRYVAVGRLGAALDVLGGAGLDEDLAKLLADLPPASTGQIDSAEHAAAVGSVPPDLLAVHPRILIHLADTYVLDGHLEDYRATIQRARALVLDHGPDTTDLEALEVLATDCSVRLVASDDDVLIAEAETLLARPDLPPMARGRLLGAVGRATAGRRTTPALRTGARQLEEAAQLLQHAGAPTHAFASRVIAATVASWPLGRYDAALEQLDQVLQAARNSLRIRVSTLPYRAFILIEVGRYAEARAALAELRHTAGTVGAIGNERSAAFARWGAAKLASQQGDADATWAACRAVERSDTVVDTGHGAFFRADAAQLLARVGRMDEAERLLADARGRDPGTTPLISTAAFVVAAYAGDRNRAEVALDELDGGLAVEPRDRWRVTLLHAHLLHGAGDAQAQSLAAAAFEEAAQLGYPDLPFVREPEVARMLQPLAARSSSSARDTGATYGPRITVLGGLTVEVDGRRVEPTGRPAELLGFLALQGSPCTAEQAIEALWPDGDAPRGRERLRTVLRRVRRDVGDLIERHEEQLRFRVGVTVDVDDFLKLARQARGGTVNAEDAATAALGMYSGRAASLLGSNPWAEEPRRHLDQQAMAMYDLVAESAERDGRLDDAIRTLLDALRLDPLAEDRYLVAARLLAEQGRRSRALQVLDDGARALEEEGLTASAELDRLRGYLERTAGRTSRAS